MLPSKKNFVYRFLIVLSLFLSHYSLSAQTTCNFEIQLEPDINVELGNSPSLYLAISVPLSEIENIIWTPSNTLSCDDCIEPVATPTENTCYMVMVTDTLDCTLSDTICLFVETTAITELDQAETIDLYPNPASDVLTIVSEVHLLSEIRILNAIGQQVQFISKPGMYQQSIPVFELSTGVYLLEVKMGKYFVRKKFVKI